MIRRSWVLLSKASATGRKGRTVVRDPRKATKKVAAYRKSNSAVVARSQENLPADPNRQSSSPLPFQPSHENQQSVGSSLVSYGLAGVGVAMGVTLVRAVLGF